MATRNVSSMVSRATAASSPVTAARKHKGLTQAGLCAVLGISQGHLSDIERGRRSLTDEQRRQIASATGVEAAWLVD